MGANEARHVLAMADDLGKVIALELMTAAQALDLRRDMINVARVLANRGDAAVFATKVQGGPLADAADRATFLSEVEGLRAELAEADAFAPGPAVAAAHAVIRERIAFLARDRALDGDVQTAVRMVEDNTILDAARAVLAG
jgi:histidine ammonia-lyase